MLCRQQELYRDDQRENPFNLMYHKSKLMKVAPTASIQPSRFVALVKTRFWTYLSFAKLGGVFIIHSIRFAVAFGVGKSLEGGFYQGDKMAGSAVWDGRPGLSRILIKITPMTDRVILRLFRALQRAKRLFYM